MPHNAPKATLVVVGGNSQRALTQAEQRKDKEIMVRKNKQKKPTIDENKLATVVPGMLISAKTLIELGDKEKDSAELSFGNIIATTMITAQCTELLLKYKLEQEQRSYKKNTHDLYNLYKALSEESKAEIQKNFNEETSRSTLPNGWDSTESVFLKARNALVYWRYVVNLTNRTGLTTIYPHVLYITAVSVYRTTPIAELVLTKQWITDPAIKAKILGKPLS